MTENNKQEPTTVQRKSLHRRLDAVGWGLFFIWIGTAILIDVGWGIVLIGIGLLILVLRLAEEYLPGAVRSGTSKACC